LDLSIDQVEIIPLLIILVVSRVYHTDAFLDAVCSSGTHFFSLVFKSEENQSKVFLGVKELVKSDDRELFAKFPKNQHCTIFFDVL